MHKKTKNKLRMTLITSTKDLDSVCKTLRKNEFVTVDTEFLRDKTYYAKLCLVQISGPDKQPYAIDVLAKGIDLSPLYDLLFDLSVVKVFHAARQDLEIIYNLTDKIVEPLFDTQIAAMVCGYGDSIGYNNLIERITGQILDKASQFSDWAHRPLSNKQLNYALDDVTYLCDAYKNLLKELENRGRAHWVKEEMQTLTSPETYDYRPCDAWKRVKVRTNKGQTLAILKELATWREKKAQEKNVPRNRIVRDDTLVDIAVNAPDNPKKLSVARNVSSDMAHGKFGQEILKAVKKGKECPKEDWPKKEKKKHLSHKLVPTLEMLKMLLRIKAAEHEVAAKLIANAEDLEFLCADDNANIPALKGWRKEVFGADALAMKHGKTALVLEEGRIKKIEV